MANLSIIQELIEEKHVNIAMSSKSDTSFSDIHIADSGLKHYERFDWLNEIIINEHIYYKFTSKIITFKYWVTIEYAAKVLAPDSILAKARGDVKMSE